MIKLNDELLKAARQIYAMALREGSFLKLFDTKEEAEEVKDFLKTQLKNNDLILEYDVAVIREREVNIFSTRYE